jgi:hypothetical protein
MAITRVVAAISWSGAPGGPGVNVWHLRTDASVADISEHMDQLEAFYTAVAGIYCTDTTITLPSEGVSVEATPTQVALGQQRTIQGTGGTGHLPPANQICVSWGTLAATRSGHGRTFLGPLWEQCQDDDGTPTPGILSGVRQAAQDLVDANQPDDAGAWGVYSQRQNVIRDFTSARVRDTFAVLRSRRD